MRKTLQTSLGGLAVACGVALASCASAPARRVDVPRKDYPYSFTRAPYIHPAIVQGLTTWLSDLGDQVVAINLLESQGSNRYSGDVHVRQLPGGRPFVYVEGEKEQFGYRYVGKTDSGVHVLNTSYSGGGSGSFESLMFVVFERDRGTRSDADTEAIRVDRERLLIVKLGEVGLGDRYAGRLEVHGNQLSIGKDEGWFAGSGGEGGGGRTEDVVLTIDMPRQPGAGADVGQPRR